MRSHAKNISVVDVPIAEAPVAGLAIAVPCIVDYKLDLLNRIFCTEIFVITVCEKVLQQFKNVLLAHLDVVVKSD